MQSQIDLVAAFALIEDAVDSVDPADLRAFDRLVEASERPDGPALPDGPAPVGPSGRLRPDPSRLVAAAAVGSGLMAATTWQTGATSWPGPGPTWQVPGFAAYCVGLATLVVAWLLLGRALLGDGIAAPVRVVRRFAAAGAGPFVISAPMGRDLWAYAAQGHLVSTGLSPYRFGPGSAPGAFARQVGHHWVFTPSPYGPVWLRMSQAAAWLAHGHPVVAVLLLRIPAFVGMALCGWAVPVLAQRAGAVGPRSAGSSRAAAGVQVPVALWLGVASPLMLVLGVGGGHNDVLMLGLALGGVAVATRPGLAPLALGAGIATLGVLIKSPAAIAVAFTVPASLIADVRPTVSRFVASCCAAAAGCAATLLGVTAASGLGFGWMGRVNSYADWVNFLSLPSALTMLGKALTGDGSPRAVDDTLRNARTIGEIVTVTVLVAVWVLASKRGAWTVGCLAVAFGASAMLAPAVQPWYYLWGLVLAGLVVRRRAGVLALAVMGIASPITSSPSGANLDASWGAAPAIVFAVGFVALFLVRREPTR